MLRVLEKRERLKLVFRSFATLVYLQHKLCVDTPSVNINVDYVLSLLEHLTIHQMSVHTMANEGHVLKTKVLDDEPIKYFIQSLKINWLLLVSNTT